MKTSLLIIVVGVFIFGYAWSLPVYKNETEYYNKLSELTAERNSNEYFKLRDESLTIKYLLEDYGLTLISVGLVLMVVFRKGWREFSSPKRKYMIMLIGLSAAFLTTAFTVFSLIMDAGRDAFPPWADSLAIPLIGIPVLGAVLIGWAVLHFLFLNDPFVTGCKIITGINYKRNIWLLFISTITAILFLYSIFMGDFWYVIPSALWLYFYLSLLRGREGGSKRVQQ